MAVGKTAVADALIQTFQLRKISSSGYLRAVAAERGLPDTRTALQELGDLLDKQTEFAWLVDTVAQTNTASAPEQLNWFVDAVRKPEQVGHFRAKFPHVLHAHFTAPEEVLRERFSKRARAGDNVGINDTYERSVAHPNERAARDLGAIADLEIDLSASSPDQAAAMIFTTLDGDS